MTRWLMILSLVFHIALSLSASAFQTDGKPAVALAPPDPQFSPSGHYTGPLNLPHVVRFQALPFRMHLDPLIPATTVVTKLDERYFPLWVRVLEEATDTEIQELAAISLARAAELKLADYQRYASAADRANEPQLARVLRSFTPTLATLNDERIAKSEFDGALAQLKFELKVVQARLSKVATAAITNTLANARHV